MIAGGRGLGTADAMVIAIYALGVVALGLYAGRRPKDGADFFLASRASRWPMIGLALIASNISSSTLIGLAGAAYATGISVFDYEWMASVILVFFCAFFLPFVLASRVYTMPEFLERRYGAGIRLYFSALTLLLSVAVDTAGSLYAGSLMFGLILPGVAIWKIVGGLALLAGIYTIAGGLKAVLYTETVQAVVLLCASAVLAWLAFAHAGGIHHVLASVDPAKLSLIRPVGDKAVPWPGMILGVPILGFYFWCTNQFMVQRVLSARSLDHGRWGSLFAGLLKLSVLFLMVLPGSAAILLYPDLPKSDLVYPTLLFDLLPAGLLGLVVAGFLAAVMSSTASTFNSAATLFTMDFVAPRWPQMKGRALVCAGRAATFVFMIVAILWAPQIGRFEGLWAYIQQTLSYLAPPMVAVFLVGLFWPRANTRGAVCAIVAGLVAAALIGVAEATGTIGLHFLYIAPLLCLIAAVAHCAGSLSAPAPSAERLAGLIWTPAYWRAETAALAGVPAWQNYRWLSVALLALTGMLVFVFR